MDTLTLTLDDKKVQKMLKNVERGLRNPEPAFRKIKEFQLKEINEAFNVAGKNILGSPWAKLKSATLRQKLKYGFQTPILVRTSQMRKTFKEVKLTKNELQISNPTKYFPHHEKGTRKMPKRQMLGHSAKMIKRTLKIFSDYLIKLAKRG